MTCEGAKFEALRNAIYHTSRKSFYDFWNRFFSFVVIVAGAAAVAAFSKTVGFAPPTALAAVATIAAALQLVFDFGGKSATHAYLQRRYYDLLAEITENPGEENAMRWEACLSRIYGDEPPPKRALDAVAFNAACQALRGNNAPRVKINPWQNFWRQWYSFPGSKFPVTGANAENASPSA